MLLVQNLDVLEAMLRDLVSCRIRERRRGEDQVFFYGISEVGAVVVLLLKTSPDKLQLCFCFLTEQPTNCLLLTVKVYKDFGGRIWAV